MDKVEDYLPEVKVSQKGILKGICTMDIRYRGCIL